MKSNFLGICLWGSCKDKQKEEQKAKDEAFNKALAELQKPYENKTNAGVYILGVSMFIAFISFLAVKSSSTIHKATGT